MYKLHTKILLLLLFGLLLASCEPNKIIILYGEDRYQGRILTDFEGVIVNKSKILMSPNSKLAVKNPGTTQFIAQCQLKLIDGNGWDIKFRTTLNPIDSLNFITFHYSKDKSWIRNSSPQSVNDSIIKISNLCEKDSLATIKIMVEGDYSTISINSKKLFESRSYLPATEYLIFEVLPGSLVEISNLGFLDLKDITMQPDKNEKYRYGGFPKILIKTKKLK